MDVVFIDKKATVENGQEQPKTVLRLDTTKKNQGRCTVMQIIGLTPTFNGMSPWRDGSVTSLGEIKEWADNHTEDYDAYVYDGKKEQTFDEYFSPESEDETEDKGEDGNEESK